jgi:hypothetical protein
VKLENEKSLDLVLTRLAMDDKEGESAAEKHELRRGDLCPQCRQEHLDYDGLLNLSCAHCGYALGGCFT